MTETEKRTRGKVKKLTFLYKAEDKLKLISHESSQFTVSGAWEECVSSNPTLLNGAQKVIAFKGEVEISPEKLRKPTYEELLKKEGWAE